VVSNKKVVILGCGFAGAAVAAQLDAHFDVTVVSRHEEFVHYIAGLRAAVVPGFEKKVTIPLDNLLTRGTLLKGVEAVKVGRRNSAPCSLCLTSAYKHAYRHVFV
jgi:NADH dehydrogenase FAD-containing subunit